MLSYFLTSLGIHDESLKMSLLDLTQYIVPTNAKWATVSRLQFLVNGSLLPSVFQVSALGVFWHSGFISIRQTHCVRQPRSQAKIKN